jgi:inorganic pyrophosphatase
LGEFSQIFIFILKKSAKICPIRVIRVPIRSTHHHYKKTMFHPWHQVSAGDKCPEIVTAVVEIPKGGRAKYEIDKESGLIRLDRVLYGSMMYPTHYGIIPQTLFDDGDPLDILILTQVTLAPLTLVTARVVGVMRMIDQGVADDKIIAVAEKDMSVVHIQDINDLNAPFMDELRHFFENYTRLEGKSVQVPAFLDKKTAKKVILRSLKMYKEKFI